MGGGKKETRLILRLGEGMKFSQYMTLFEERVLIRMRGKQELVPARPGRLARSGFGRKVGCFFESDRPVVINYYGHFKKSVSFVEVEGQVRDQYGGQIRMISGEVVHFASVRIEDVARLAPDLVKWFPHFKTKVLKLRGFLNGTRTD